MSLLLLAAIPAGLTLQIASPQEAVLVGEPVKVVVAWRAARAMDDRIFPENERFTNQSLVFVVSRGGTEQQYRETPRSVEERVEPVVRLGAGDEVMRNLILIHGTLSGGSATVPAEGFLFAAKGRYQLRAVYAKNEHWIESNSLSFDVSEPDGTDRDVLLTAMQVPTILRAGGDAQTQARARALLKDHPGSRYLRWARLQILQERAMALHNQQDPETHESMRHLDKKALREFRVNGYRRLAEEILEERDWGPYEEEALGAAHMYAQAGGDAQLSQRARDGLFAKYPRSMAVRRIKENETEDENDETPSKRPSPKANE